MKKQDIMFSSKQKLNANKKLWLLIFKSYVSSFRHIFFSFVQPVLFFAIFYFIFTSKLGEKPSSVIPGYILIAPITTSLISFSAMLSEWKSSILLKRLDITPVSKFNFLSIMIFYYFLFAFVSAFWMILWAVIFLSSQGTSLDSVFQNIHWGWLVLTLIQLIFICNTFGILASGFAKSENDARGMVMAFYFPFVFLGGIMLPLGLVDHNSVMRGITYIIPFKYPATLSYMAWNSAEPIINYVSPSGSSENFTEFPNSWLPVLIGFLYGGLAFGTSLKTFKWNNNY